MPHLAPVPFVMGSVLIIEVGEKSIVTPVVVVHSFIYLKGCYLPPERSNKLIMVYVKLHSLLMLRLNHSINVFSYLGVTTEYIMLLIVHIFIQHF